MKAALGAAVDGTLGIGMTTPSSSDRPADGGIDAERRRAGKEASVLFVLLSEQPDDAALMARIDAWRAESALHEEVWQRTSRTYRMMGGSPAIYEAEWRAPAVRHEAVPMAPAAAAPRQRRQRRRVLLAGAALAVAACLAIAAAPAVLLRLEADVVTATAELRTIDLEDGSRIRLAPRSAIGVGFSSDERRIRLLQGEAFFDVTPDARRPFRVVASDVVATVLGTAFEVALRDDGASVAVQHGQVRVDDGRAWPPLSTTLQAGDWLRVGAHAVAERGTRSPSDIGDWTAAQFVARNRPIAEIVDRLRGYYGGVIVVQDSAFAGRLVSGVYDLHDPETTLRNLASAHDAVVRQLSPWMLLVTAR